MQAWLDLPCADCGATSPFSLRDAGRWVSCRRCRAPIRVPPLGKPVAPRSPASAPSIVHSGRRIWGLAAVAALMLPPATGWLVQRHRRAQAEDRANQSVASQVEAARMKVSQQRWDEAAALLQTALATDDATDLEEARAVWTHVRREQASGILRAAESALANQLPAQALSLIRTYLEDPYAADREPAAQLKEQLELITSDADAIAFLRRLSDAALTEFARNGTLAELDGVTHPDVRAIHLQRLRGCLAAEFQRRHQERTGRLQRICATPAYGELQDFTALTRRRLLAQGGGAIDYRLLACLFRELNVQHQDEQQRILATISTRLLDLVEAEKIARIRASLKERFRTYRDFDRADCEIFDRIVDQEMYSLLQDLHGAPKKAPDTSW